MWACVGAELFFVSIVFLCVWIIFCSFFPLLFLYMCQVILYKVFSLPCALFVTRRKPSQAHHFIRGTLALILHLCTLHWLRVLCFQPWKNNIKSKGALHPHIAHNKVTREVTSHDSSCGPRFKSAVWTRDFNQSLTTLPSPTHKSLNWSRGDVILFSLFTRSISFLVPYHGEFCAIRKPTGRPRLEFVQIILFWNSSKLFYSSPNALYT